MKNLLRHIARYALALVACCLVFLLLQLAAAKVPQERVQANMEASATYYADHWQVEYLVEDCLATQLHYVADDIWFSISYGLGFGEPLEAVVWSYFYIPERGMFTDGLTESVYGQLPGNTEYLRYWHGPAALLRFLHLNMDAPTIYQLLCLVMATLVVVLVAVLCYARLGVEAVGLLVSLVMVSAWIVPLCLEYVWMFLVMLVASIVTVRIADKGQWERMGMVMLVTGSIAAYLDFLTTETLTLLVPLMFALRVIERQPGDAGVHGRDLWRRALVPCCTWAVGFAGTWAAKWLISYVVLGQDVMPYVTGHVSERLGGDMGLSLPQFLWGAVAKNVQRLFVFDYGMVGAATFVGLIAALLVPVLCGKLRLKATIDREATLLYLALGAVPYLRYLVLHNHSYGHHCFTYRAQAATIIALCIVLLELLDRVRGPSKADRSQEGEVAP